MSDLKIVKVHAEALRLPIVVPISSSLGTYTHVDCTVVHVQTDGGPTGAGFTACLGGHASSAIVPYIRDELAPLAVGQDAGAPEALWNRLWGPNKARLNGGMGAWALSAIDIAVWDVLAKQADMPLASLLGGHRSSVPVYGSGGWHSLSDDELVKECQRFAAMGIRWYKYKIGTSRDRERTALLRREMGDDFGLLVDANQKYSVREAIEVSAMLADYGVAWLEEPVVATSTDDLAAVAGGSHVPIAAGENSYFRWGFREICDRQAAAYLQPDVGRCGGVTEFRKIAALSESFGLALTSHLWHELSISLVGASSAGWAAEYAELIPSGVLTRSFDVIDGEIAIPDVPGHGVMFTEDAMSSYRTA